MGLRRLCCLRGVTPTADYLPRLPSISLGTPLYRLGGLASPRPSHPSPDGSPASEIRCQTAPLSSDCSLPKVLRPHPWEKGSITLFPSTRHSPMSTCHILIPLTHYLCHMIYALCLSVMKVRWFVALFITLHISSFFTLGGATLLGGGHLSVERGAEVNLITLHFILILL